MLTTVLRLGGTELLVLLTTSDGDGQSAPDLLLETVLT
jgi:hypothetical protein